MEGGMPLLLSAVWLTTAGEDEHPGSTIYPVC